MALFQIHRESVPYIGKKNGASLQLLESNSSYYCPTVIVLSNADPQKTNPENLLQIGNLGQSG